MPRQMLLLDACVAINLVATDRLHEIAETLSSSFTLVSQAAREVGKLRQIVDGSLTSVPIVLDDYLANGSVQIIELTEEELLPYVELAALVDDGEAATIAVASKRSLPMATDDRKARRVCRERGVPDPQRTVGLVRAYVELMSLSTLETREMLLRVREGASFIPPKGDPDHKWWNDYLRIENG